MPRVIFYTYCYSAGVVGLSIITTVVQKILRLKSFNSEPNSYTKKVFVNSLSSKIKFFFLDIIK